MRNSQIVCPFLKPLEYCFSHRSFERPNDHVDNHACLVKNINKMKTEKAHSHFQLQDFKIINIDIVKICAERTTRMFGIGAGIINYNFCY